MARNKGFPPLSITLITNLGGHFQLHVSPIGVHFAEAVAAEAVGGRQDVPRVDDGAAA